MVRLDEVRELMDHMMETPIFLTFEKGSLLKDENYAKLDPNLIMDTRHKIFREDLSVSPAKFTSLLDEARRLLTDDEARELNIKKERDFLESELKKFEKELFKSRPKFHASHACSKKTFARSDDQDFWKISNTIKVKVSPAPKARYRPHVDYERRRTSTLETESTRCTKNDVTVPASSSGADGIRVTINDKPKPESAEKRLELLRKAFDVWRQNVREKRRLRVIKIKIKEKVISRRLQSCFQKWREYVKDRRKLKRVLASNVCPGQSAVNEKKIDEFVDLIAAKQKEFKQSSTKSSTKEENSVKKNARDTKIVTRKTRREHATYESPMQSRLNAQKMIIEKQRSKLAEQGKIIEELKLKQFQEEFKRSSKDTIDVAKETLMRCSQGSTKRTLIQLMRQAGYRDKCSDEPRRVARTPDFLIRMEARAETRKARAKIAEETRRKKLEEQKVQREAAKREEEKEKRRLQREAVQKARKARVEEEQQRIREQERFKQLNEMADEFYQKYLLRRYVMEPFKQLIEIKRNRTVRAEEHYKKTLLRRALTSWRMETEIQLKVKIEAAQMLYSRNLMWYAFRDWREMARETRRMLQVANDFYEMRLLERSFKEFRGRILKLKEERLEKERLADDHYRKKLRAKYFKIWKRYPEVAEEIKESERRRNKWRSIVRQVIPDFAPKHNEND